MSDFSDKIKLRIDKENSFSSKNVGERIKNRRIQLGLSVDEVANKLGKDRATLYRWEGGYIEKMPVNSIKPLADILQTTPEYLIGFNNFIDELKNEDIQIPASKLSYGIKIPVLGTIPAGIPIEAVEDILDYEEISENLAKTGEFFALKVRGNSMIPTINDGDVVIVKKVDNAESGKICVIMINGFDATLKQIKKEQNGIWVLPHNPNCDFKPMFYSNSDIERLPVKIIGVAVEIRRTL